MKNIICAVVFLLTLLSCYAQDKNAIISPPKSEMVINNSLNGAGGQLIVNLPAQAYMLCMVARAGEVKNIASLKNGIAKDLLPGNYDIIFQGIKFSVAVEKGKDTRIKAGVLQSTVKGLWEIWADGVKIFSAGSPKFVALTPGNYIVKTNGAEIKTTINDGKVTMFSFTKY